jgi:flavorubredoxin
MNKSDTKIIDVTPVVKWIGVMDYDIRTFDIVMHTAHGTTYNSYFIDAEKKTIIEVAKEKFSEVYFSKLRSVTNPEELQYIILNHTEPDHSGSLKSLLEIAPDAIVVGSGNAIRYLEDIVNAPFNSLVVKDGDSLDLGNKTLKFISAPNLHWPDSMFTLLVEEKVLFTCDAFGAHYCSSEMYSKFTEPYLSAFKYYFDMIMSPYSRFMLKAIEKIKPLDFEFICTGHGPIHGDNTGKAIALCEQYASGFIQKASSLDHRNILVAYVSAYGYTSEAAELIASGILETEGITVDICDIENIAMDDLESKILSADGILVGSPTINQNTLLPVYKLLSLINPLRDRGKLAGSFGSYGWSGESPKIILESFRILKLKIFEESGAFKFSPEGPKENYLKDLGRKFAAQFIEGCEQIKNPGY